VLGCHGAGCDYALTWVRPRNDHTSILSRETTLDTQECHRGAGRKGKKASRHVIAMVPGARHLAPCTDDYVAVAKPEMLTVVADNG
jgi:hypothetical protein